MKIRTEIQPNSCNDFATKSLISEVLYYYAEKVENFEIVENHRAAYGCPAYQILEVSEVDAQKIKKELSWY